MGEGLGERVWIGGNDTIFANNPLVLELPHIVSDNLSNLDRLSTNFIMLVIAIMRRLASSGCPFVALAFKKKGVVLKSSLVFLN